VQLELFEAAGEAQAALGGPQNQLVPPQRIGLEVALVPVEVVRDEQVRQAGSPLPEIGRIAHRDRIADAKVLQAQRQAVRGIERGAIAVPDRGIVLLLVPFAGGEEELLVCIGAVREAAVFYVTQVDGEPLPLRPVEVAKVVLELQLLDEAQLRGEPEGLVQPSHVVDAHLEAVVDPAQVSALVDPPVAEVAVGDVEDGRGKDVPPFAHADLDAHPLARQRLDPEVGRVEQSGVENLFPVALQLPVQVGQPHPLALLETQLAQDDACPRAVVAFDVDTIDRYDGVGRERIGHDRALACLRDRAAGTPQASEENDPDEKNHVPHGRIRLNAVNIPGYARLRLLLRSGCLRGLLTPARKVPAAG
jgi:hypothetical protein